MYSINSGRTVEFLSKSLGIAEGAWIAWDQQRANRKGQRDLVGDIPSLLMAPSVTCGRGWLSCLNRRRRELTFAAKAAIVVE